MNKSDLVARMAKKSGVSQSAAEVALNEFMAGVSDALKKGERVTLVGFGSWDVRKRAARKGRNPQNGKALSIPARRVVRFRTGSELKGRVK
ncbi:MAG: HU family DNA-binding protein [bacterium]|nr:HU family DNA-binding protein [bacterium]